MGIHSLLEGTSGGHPTHWFFGSYIGFIIEFQKTDVRQVLRVWWFEAKGHRRSIHDEVGVRTCSWFSLTALILSCEAVGTCFQGYLYLDPGVMLLRIQHLMYQATTTGESFDTQTESYESEYWIILTRLWMMMFHCGWMHWRNANRENREDSHSGMCRTVNL